MNRIMKASAAFALAAGAATAYEASQGDLDRAAALGMTGIAVVAAGAAETFRRSSQQAERSSAYFKGETSRLRETLSQRALHQIEQSGRKETWHEDQLRDRDEQLAEQSETILDLKEKNKGLTREAAVLRRDKARLGTQVTALRQDVEQKKQQVSDLKEVVAQLEGGALADKVIITDLRGQLAAQETPILNAYGSGLRPRVQPTSPRKKN
jgi:predicted RNase H-like nuclease (RuvC/YqgF family)